MVLPERSEDQPRDIVTAMMRLTTLDETVVREHLAIMSSADALNAWERIRAYETAIGRSVSRPEDLPDAVVSEIKEFSGVNEDAIRSYLALRHVMDAIAAWERFAQASAAERRLRRWQVRLAFGRPLPPWAEELIDELGAEEGQRDLPRELIAATIALVGGGQEEVRAWLAARDPTSGRTPVEVVREDGWEALDHLLGHAFARGARE